MISKPKEYIDILLQDLVKTIQIATRNYFDERYGNLCSMADSENRFDKAMEKVDSIKSEIFYVIGLAGDKDE